MMDAAPRFVNPLLVVAQLKPPSLERKTPADGVPAKR
jgi:hypothetical protein